VENVVLGKDFNLGVTGLLFHAFTQQGIQTKNSFDEILSLCFDLGFLKVNTYGIIKEPILQRTIKRILI
jgi:hypothetical protein